MDFFNRTGKIAIGSRLRMLTDAVTSDASQIYELYGIDIKSGLPPKKSTSLEVRFGDC